MPEASEQGLAPVGKRWPRFREDLGVLLWASFLAACITTMFFFAFFDPLQLAAAVSSPSWLMDRMTAYAIGFFFFWAMCTIASFLTAFLIDTRSPDQSAS
jgi:hypothetical protein